MSWIERERLRNVNKRKMHVQNAKKITGIHRKICKCVTFLLPSLSWLFELANKRALAMSMATATRTPQIKNLIGQVVKNKRAARAAPTYEQVRAVICKIIT